MANIFDRVGSAQLQLGLADTSTTRTGVALDSAYTYASAGDALGVIWCAPVSGNLTDVWFLVTAITGTPGNLSVVLRDWNATNTPRPGTTARATQAVSPGTTANKWINAHFSTPYGVTIGAYYWIVIADAAGSGSNYATVCSKAFLTGTRQLYVSYMSYLTTDGWATDGSSQSAPPALVLKFADGSLFGNPYSAGGSYGTDTLERGIKITALVEDLTISGVSFTTGSNSVSGLKVYSGAVAPGSTPALTVTFGAGSSHRGNAYFAPFTLAKNTVHRVVLTFGGNTSTPGYYEIEDAAASADLTNCGFGGGTLMSTVDNGAGGWTDEVAKFPRMGIIIRDQVARAGGLINAGLVRR